VNPEQRPASWNARIKSSMGDAESLFHNDIKTVEFEIQ
jgi:hypothetical protein